MQGHALGEAVGKKRDAIDRDRDTKDHCVGGTGNPRRRGNARTVRESGHAAPNAQIVSDGGPVEQYDRRSHAPH